MLSPPQADEASHRLSNFRFSYSELKMNKKRKNTIQELKESFASTLLSERALARDWLRPEEDEAWSIFQKRFPSFARRGSSLRSELRRKTKKL